MKFNKFISIIIAAALFLQCSLFASAINVLPFNNIETTQNNLGFSDITQSFIEDITYDPDTSSIYSYTGDKLKQIASATTKYNFIYNETDDVSSAYIGDTLFARYSYTGDSLVSSIEFGNNQIINKDHDSQGRVVSVEYDNMTAFEYDYINHGEIGFEKDFLSSRTTTTNDIFEIKSMDTDNQLFYVEEKSKNSHLFSIAESDDIIRSISDSQNQTQIEFLLENGEICTILCAYDDYSRIVENTIYSDALSIHEYYDYIDTQSDYIRSYRYVIEGEFGKIEYSRLYEYDVNGNLTNIRYAKNGSEYEIESSYEYDEHDQLICTIDESENQQFINYDNSGNILQKTSHSKQKQDDSVYTYSDEEWGDKLTAYNNAAIIYDEIGNPVVYNGNQYTWSAGRQLSSYQNLNSNLKVSYTYDEIGHRTKKTIEEDGSKINYEYFWLGDVLISMTVSGIVEGVIDTVYFLYDIDGNIYGFIKNGTEMYFYEKSKTGDIIAVYNETGVVANYTYDDYGNIISSYEDDDSLRYCNPFYYRSYFYDREANMYYLLSRYYMPEWGRFLNADAYFATSEGFFDVNMFTYCNNNPVNESDPYGYWSKEDHRNWSKEWAGEAGMSSSLATKVGDGSYSVDIDMSTNPLRAPIKWRYNQRFHFDRRYYCDNVSGGEDTRIFYAELYIEDAINARKKRNTSSAADLLGKALHFLQDYSSHGNKGLNSFIASHGSGFDDPKYDWENDSTRISVYKLPANYQLEGCPKGYGNRYIEAITLTALILLLYNL